MSQRQTVGFESIPQLLEFFTAPDLLQGCLVDIAQVDQTVIGANAGDLPVGKYQAVLACEDILAVEPFARPEDAVSCVVEKPKQLFGDVAQKYIEVITEIQLSGFFHLFLFLWSGGLVSKIKQISGKIQVKIHISTICPT